MKLISLAPSCTETLFYLGLGEKVIGVTEQCNYPEEAKEKEKIGSFACPDIKKIVSLKPDLIITCGKIHEKFLGEFRKHDIAVFDFAPESVKDTLDRMEKLGRICGQDTACGVLVDALRQRINKAIGKIPERASSPRVFRLIRMMNRKQMFTPCPGSYQYDAILVSGGKPMPFAVETSYAKVSLEKVIEFNPEIIISCGRKKGEKPKPKCKGCSLDNPICQQEIEEIYSWKEWCEISAVKKRQVFALPCRTICRPGPNVADLVERLVRIFYLE